MWVIRTWWWPGRQIRLPRPREGGLCWAIDSQGRSPGAKTGWRQRRGRTRVQGQNLRGGRAGGRGSGSGRGLHSSWSRAQAEGSRPRQRHQSPGGAEGWERLKNHARIPGLCEDNEKPTEGIQQRSDKMGPWRERSLWVQCEAYSWFLLWEPLLWSTPESDRCRKGLISCAQLPKASGLQMVLTPLSTKQHSDPIVLISNRTVAAPEIKQNLLLLTVSQLPVTHSVPAQGGKKKRCLYTVPEVEDGLWIKMRKTSLKCPHKLLQQFNLERSFSFQRCMLKYFKIKYYVVWDLLLNNTEHRASWCVWMK